MAVHTFVAGEAFTAAQANTINTGADTGTYTPTLGGMAIGTGGSAANTASFNFIGGVLFVEGSVIFGTSGQTFPTAPTVTLPTGYTVTTVTVNRPCGLSALNDAGVGTFSGECRVASSTTVQFVAEQSSATSGIVAAISTTSPMTWAAGDSILYEFWVRATYTP